MKKKAKFSILFALTVVQTVGRQKLWNRNLQQKQ